MGIGSNRGRRPISASLLSSIPTTSALELVREFQQAPALIIDVRGNAGGSTPSDLTASLMDRPYRFWTESTPINMMPYFRFRAIQGDWHYGPFRQPQMLGQNPPTAPPKDAFKGK